MKGWKNLFGLKKMEPEPDKKVAFQLRRFNEFKVANANWGYFQWCEYFIESSVPFDGFDALFRLLKDSDFFKTSIAYSGRINENTFKEHDDAWYGRYVFQTIYESDFVQLHRDAFIDRLQLSVAAQEKQGMDWGRGFRTTIQPNYLEIVPFIQKLAFPSVVFYELVIDETTFNEKVSKISNGIWDYFKCFIGFDAASNRVYRIDMGID